MLLFGFCGEFETLKSGIWPFLSGKHKLIVRGRLMKHTNQLPKGADSTCDFSPTFCIFLSQTVLVWRDVEWPGGINFLHRMCSKLKKKEIRHGYFFNSLELDVFLVKGFLMQFFHTFLRVQFLMLTKSNFNTTTFQLEHRLALSKVLLSYALLIFETLKKAHELQKVLENKDVHHSRMLARPLPGHDIFHFFA